MENMIIGAGVYPAFPKIGRLKRGCCVTEKIDGTNALIAIDEDGTFRVGSRTQWITPERDNYGFARWAYEHKEELLKLGPGKHYGEWWGNGIQRRYGQGRKNFSLFNVNRWRDGREPRPECCGVVPILAEGDFTTTLVDDALQALSSNGSTAAPGFMQPEGVVVFHHALGIYFKVTLDHDGVPKTKVS